MPTTVDAREEIEALLRGFQVPRMLRLVAELEVADKIPLHGKMAVQDLAARCGVLAEPILRVLRALAAFQIFRVTEDGQVSHTPLSRLLRTDTPSSMHHAALFWTAPGCWSAWGRLDAAMEGNTPNDTALGMSRFEYLRQHPEEARVFDAMMANFPDPRHSAIAAAYDFSAAGSIVDIGGGNGATLREVLKVFPKTRGIVFDRQDVVDAITSDQCSNGRIEPRAGSFFEDIPRGADIYMVVWVLHNWADEECLRILRACRQAMSADSILLIGEQILEPDPAKGRAADYLVDVHMMAMFGRAKHRTEDEWRSLLDQSGFSLGRIIPTASSVSILEATPTSE